MAIMRLVFCLVTSFFFLPLMGQGNIQRTSFIEFQKSFPRMNEVMKRREDTLRKQFAQKQLVWPAKYVYIRSFKYDSQLEVWVKQTEQEPYQLFKTYPVCALAGTLGPKRMQGDYQVPEGFYYINEMNPRSMYHFSLGLNYPNAADRLLSDSIQPGGDIYIHGSCVTTGCIPIQNGPVEELYILATWAREVGQEFIPVHVYPIRYSNPKSAEYLQKLVKSDSELDKHSQQLKPGFDYFEKHRQLPIIAIGAKGEYKIFDRYAR